MNPDDLENLLQPDTFTPFVVTLKDKDETALAVTDYRKAMIFFRMLVMVGADMRLYHIPFRSILHITMRGDQIGN